MGQQPVIATAPQYELVRPGQRRRFSATRLTLRLPFTIAERFFSGVLHAHLLGVRSQDIFICIERSPRGWEGVALREGREVRGCDRAHLLSGSESSAGWREGCRRDWRAHCPAGCEGGTSSERDRLVRFLGPQGAVMCHSIGPSECEPHRPAGGRRRGPRHRGGSCESGCRCWGESEHNGSCG